MVAVHNSTAVNSKARYVERAFSPNLNSVVTAITESQVSNDNVVRRHQEYVSHGRFRSFIGPADDDGIPFSIGAPDYQARATNINRGNIEQISAVREQDGGWDSFGIRSFNSSLEVTDTSDVADLSSC